MTFSNYNNTSEDDEFIRAFPIPDEFDSESIPEVEQEKSCRDCEYYTNEVILPCAVNPSNIYHAEDCNDYEEKS